MALLSHDRVCTENKFVCLFVNIYIYIYIYIYLIYNICKFICIVSSLVHKSLKNKGNEIITFDTALRNPAFCDLVNEFPVLW